MDKEIRIGEVSISQVEDAFSTLIKATEAALDAINKGEGDDVFHFLALMGLLNIGFQTGYRSVLEIANVKIKMRNKARPVETRDSRPSSITIPIPSGEKS